MAILYCYWHLVVKHCNFTLLLTSSSQQWQFPPPHSTLSEDRVISSLFSVVIDTQRQIYPPLPLSTLAEDRVISSLFNIVIDTQRQIYPQFNTGRGQSDLFTVQCCHWHSKADIPLQSTLAEDSVISSPFNVVIDTQRQIYPPVNTNRGQSDLFTVQCCHWHSKADIPPIQHLSEDRVISSLFNVVIETQRYIYSPHLPSSKSV